MGYSCCSIQLGTVQPCRLFLGSINFWRTLWRYLQLASDSGSFRRRRRYRHFRATHQDDQRPSNHPNGEAPSLWTLRCWSHVSELDLFSFIWPYSKSFLAPASMRGVLLTFYFLGTARSLPLLSALPHSLNQRLSTIRGPWALSQSGRNWSQASPSSSPAHLFFDPSSRSCFPAAFSPRSTQRRKSPTSAAPITSICAVTAPEASV